jgi:large subunit ribosomal protein L6
MKSLYVGEITKIFLAVINKQQSLVVKKNLEKAVYINVPKDLYLKKEKNFLIVCNKNKKSTSFPLFFFKLSRLIVVRSIIKKKLILKGVGYRISFSDNLKDIIFKLGYSHLIVLPIPTQIFSVSITKNLISMQSYDITFLGNFLAKIVSLRSPDPYKGKGFLRKNEKIELKQLKKK